MRSMWWQIRFRRIWVKIVQCDAIIVASVPTIPFPFPEGLRPSTVFTNGLLHCFKCFALKGLPQNNWVHQVFNQRHRDCLGKSPGTLSPQSVQGCHNQLMVSATELGIPVNPGILKDPPARARNPQSLGLRKVLEKDAVFTARISFRTMGTDRHLMWPLLHRVANIDRGLHSNKKHEAESILQSQSHNMLINWCYLYYQSEIRWRWLWLPLGDDEHSPGLTRPDVPTSFPDSFPEVKPCAVTSATPANTPPYKGGWQAVGPDIYLWSSSRKPEPFHSNILYRVFLSLTVKEKLSQDTSLEEIAPTTLQCSLLCPLGRTRLKLPCRAWTCKHLQCFDAATYIQMNEQKPKWCCPVCREPAQYKNLHIEGYFLNVLEENNTDDTIVLLADGSWKPMNLAEQELEQVGEAQGRIQLGENTPATEKTIHLESDDEVCTEGNYCEGNEDCVVASALSSTVETITLSDDEPSDPETPQITRTSFRFCSTPMSSKTSDRECNNEIQSSGPRTRSRTSRLLNNSEISDISSAFEDTTFEQSSNASDDSFLPLSVSSLAKSPIEATSRVLRSRTRKNYRE
ncbi:uncharacterized protein LOC125041242 [Penaeus chinensis]|uniref:uncharacterized protein LOC125041242 n=1 Tax=Penaeus chinensis TaxID=139456 RepID=UPI001FB6BF09|nr:uncharacterized protein LOC125041242 [Penaeus chinensis]